MSDLAAGGEPFHSPTRCPARGCPHQRRMVRAAWMEKIVSKSNDTSNLGHGTKNQQGRELQDNELDTVVGGSDPTSGVTYADGGYSPGSPTGYYVPPGSATAY